MLTKSEVLVRSASLNKKSILSVRHSDKTPPQEGDNVTGQVVLNGNPVTTSGIVVKVLS